MQPNQGSKVFERIRFRLILTPCCNHNLCWVNPRMPNFCPECGQSLITVRQVWESRFMLKDDEAVLEYHKP